MLLRPIVVLAFVTITFCVSAASWNDDSHYVSLGPRNGYYIVKPGSRLYRQLGLYEAPVIDTSDPFRRGYGADALTFRFNRNGVLIAPRLTSHRPRQTVFTRPGWARSFAAARPRATWKLFLARGTVGRSDPMASCGIMHCRFTIRSRSGAAAADAHTRRARAPSIDSQHASRNFSGDPACNGRFGTCGRDPNHKSQSPGDVRLRRNHLAPTLPRTRERWTDSEDHVQ
jgi:hypothetical protein